MNNLNLKKIAKRLNVEIIDDEKLDDNNKEIWKDITGFDGKYQVSNMGNVKNANTGNYFTPIKTSGSTVSVSLRGNGIHKSYAVKMLVAEHFMDKVDGKNYVKNKNGNVNENKVSNLEWVALHDLLSNSDNTLVDTTETDLDGEIWKMIKGYENIYKISNMGRIKNIITYNFIIPYKHSNSGVYISLNKNGITKTSTVKDLVANHFMDRIAGKSCIINKDGNIFNNRVDNLEFVTLHELLSQSITKRRMLHDKTEIKIESDEIWKQLEEHNLYEISNYGKIRNTKTGYLMKFETRPNGDIMAHLCEEKDKRIIIAVRRLVAKYFVQNPDNKPEVMHIDKDCKNIKATNLKWVYHYEFKKKIKNIIPLKTQVNKTQHKIDISKFKKDLVEQWKPIKNFSKYAVSNLGRIKYIKKNRMRKLVIMDGYNTVTIRNNNGNVITIRINIAVAQHFIDMPAELKDKKKVIVDHIDNNRLNDRIDNLRWLTQSGNINSYNANYKSKDNYKKILQYDKQHDLIKEWNSVNDIVQEHPEFKQGAIRSNCIGTSNTAYNYIWQYRDVRIEQPLEEDEIFKNCGTINNRDFSRYEISNYGKVRSIDRNIILKYNEEGKYYTVALYTPDGKEYRLSVHILVAELFVAGKSAINKIVNHLDENKRNPYYKNLEWTSHRGNAEHSFGKPVIMINPETNEELKTFPSLARACEYLKLDHKNPSIISDCCWGYRATAFGYKWKYKKSQI